jgi:hypothetical protein
VKNFLLSLSVVIMAGSAGCLGYGISQMGINGVPRSLSTSQAVTLYLYGFIGVHLAVVPLMTAGAIES